jgi:hypothetical protein
MNYLWKSIIIVLFLVGTAFLLTSHASRGDNRAGLVTWDNNSPKTIPAELEGETVIGLSIKSDARTKGLPVGLWGGEHISMQVADQQTTIEYDCAHGTIDQRIALDRRGRFNVSGMQVQERGGPARQDGQPAGYPVRFSGQVNGKTMKLSVRNSVTKELIGVFTLVYGSQPKLRKCM